MSLSHLMFDLKDKKEITHRFPCLIRGITDVIISS
jgi:hypothetical protein